MLRQPELGGLMPSFFIVRTKTGWAPRVRQCLIDKLFDVYYPQILQRRRNKIAEAPFLDSMLFAADDGRGVKFILSTPGVERVVHKDGVPVRLAQHVINALMRHEDDNGFVLLQPRDVSGLFQPMRAETRAFVFMAAVLRPELLGAI